MNVDISGVGILLEGMGAQNLKINCLGLLVQLVMLLVSGDRLFRKGNQNKD